MAEGNFTSEEVWKPVVGYEGFYEISSIGRLRRVGAATGARVGRIKVGSNGGGWSTTRYVIYSLSRDNKPKSIRAHTLVFEAFSGPIPEGCEINHKDSNKANNAFDNLEAISHIANMQHASAVGALLRGEDIKQSKLTEDQVRQIRAMYRPKKFGCIRVGRLFGVGGVTVWEIVKGKSWAHVV